MPSGTITLFPDKPKTPPQGVVKTDEIRSIERRLKMLEESLSNLRQQEQLNEQNTIKVTRKVDERIADFNREIDEMKKAVQKIKDDIRLIIAELQSCAKSEDVTKIEKYVTMMNPVNYVTHNELDNIIEEKLRRVLR